MLSSSISICLQTHDVSFREPESETRIYVYIRIEGGEGRVRMSQARGSKGSETGQEKGLSKDLISLPQLESLPDLSHRNSEANLYQRGECLSALRNHWL